MINPVTGLDHSVLPAVRSLPRIPEATLLAGNSFMYYNNGIVQWLEELIAADCETRMTVSMVTIAYGGVDWHDIRSYLRPGAINSYTVANDGSNRVIFRERKGAPFDAVVMQDNSQGPIHPELKKFLQKHAAKNAELLREAGVMPLLMLTWGFPGRPEMTQQLADSTISIANDNGIMVVPVGLAFAEAIRSKADIRLILADNRHPSRFGTYLETCVLYATLLHRSPEGLAWYGLGELTIPPGDAAYLQSVAWKTVTAFFGW